MKSSKAEADYQGTPKGKDRCATCSMYQPPMSCSSVEGKISPQGWCTYYKPAKASLKEAINGAMKRYGRV